jgi:hypothetical protein
MPVSLCKTATQQEDLQSGAKKKQTGGTGQRKDGPCIINQQLQTVLQQCDKIIIKHKVKH